MDWSANNNKRAPTAGVRTDSKRPADGWLVLQIAHGMHGPRSTSKQVVDPNSLSKMHQGS